MKAFQSSVKLDYEDRFEVSVWVTVLSTIPAVVMRFFGYWAFLLAVVIVIGVGFILRPMLAPVFRSKPLIALLLVYLIGGAIAASYAFCGGDAWFLMGVIVFYFAFIFGLVCPYLVGREIQGFEAGSKEFSQEN